MPHMIGLLMLCEYPLQSEVEVFSPTVDGHPLLFRIGDVFRILCRKIRGRAYPASFFYSASELSPNGSETANGSVAPQAVTLQFSSRRSPGNQGGRAISRRALRAL